MLLWSLCLTYYWALRRPYETTQKATQSQSEVIQYDLRKLLKRFGNKKGGVNNNSRSSNNIYTRCNNNTNMNDLVCIHCNWFRLWFESYGWKQVFLDLILFLSAGFHEAMKTRFYWLKFPTTFPKVRRKKPPQSSEFHRLSYWMREICKGFDQVSNGKRAPGLVRLYRGWNPTQLYRDYNKPL